jgi:hypothetical protein
MDYKFVGMGVQFQWIYIECSCTGTCFWRQWVVISFVIYTIYLCAEKTRSVDEWIQLCEYPIFRAKTEERRTGKFYERLCVCFFSLFFLYLSFSLSHSAVTHARKSRAFDYNYYGTLMGIRVRGYSARTRDGRISWQSVECNSDMYIAVVSQ